MWTLYHYALSKSNNGTVDGHKYFDCDDEHGVLVSQQKILLVNKVASFDVRPTDNEGQRPRNSIPDVNPTDNDGRRPRKEGFQENLAAWVAANRQQSNNPFVEPVKSVDGVTSFLATESQICEPGEVAVQLGIPLGISFVGTPEHGCFVYICKQGGNAVQSGKVVPGVCVGVPVDVRVCVRARACTATQIGSRFALCTSACLHTLSTLHHVCAEWMHGVHQRPQCCFNPHVLAWLLLGLQQSLQVLRTHTTQLLCFALFLFSPNFFKK